MTTGGGEDMSYGEHLSELRHRLLISLAALLVGAALSFWQMDWLLSWLTSSIGKLYIIRPAGFFLAYCKIALWSGMILASPVILFELWAFLLPALSEKAKHWIWICLPLSWLLFLGGMAFSYFLVVPKSLQFLLSLGNTTMEPLISMENYLDFVLMLVLPFGFIFNVPLLMTLLLQAGMVQLRQLQRIRRYVIFISFVLAAIITPTLDVFNQCLVACPLIIAYECSLWIGKLVIARKGG